MTRLIRVGLVAVVALSMCMGCTGRKAQERLALMEQANANLTDQLNGMQADLSGCLAERDQLATQLAAARQQSADLQAMLAARPEPQPVREPAPAPGWTTVPGGAMIAIDDSVLFDVGRATLRSDARRTLDGIVSTLQSRYSDREVLIFGHTDNQPIKKSGWDDNWELSTERALSVVRYVQERGVAPARLAAAGCGEYRPRVPNTGSSNQAANRRVEIYAMDPSLR